MFFSSLFPKTIPLFLLISLLLFLPHSSVALKSSQNTLQASSDPVMVIEVIRHGIRAPTSDEFDPYWTDKIGMLLPEGNKQMFKLGQSIAADYPHLFKNYNSEEVYVRSLNISRTMETAQAHLNGIFEGMNNRRTGPNYLKNETKGGLQLPEIHTVDLAEDYLMYSFNSLVCPSAKNRKDAQLHTDGYAIFANKMASTVDDILKLTGKDLEMHSVSQLQNTLWIDHLVKRDFPSPYDKITYKSDLWKNMTFLHDFYEFYVDFGSQNQTQLYSFMILQDILDRFTSKIHGASPQLKFVLYSGTDTLLMPILHNLGISTPECLYKKFVGEENDDDDDEHDTCLYPNFGSNIIFELHFDGSNYYVLVKYNDLEVKFEANEEGDPYLTFEEFKGIMLNAIGDMNFEKYSDICKLETKKVMMESGMMNYWCMIEVLVGFVVLVVILLEIIVHVQNKKKKYGEESNLPIIKEFRKEIHTESMRIE